jgi:hypothetical protein
MKNSISTSIRSAKYRVLRTRVNWKIRWKEESI